MGTGRASKEGEEDEDEDEEEGEELAAAEAIWTAMEVEVREERRDSSADTLSVSTEFEEVRDMMFEEDEEAETSPLMAPLVAPLMEGEETPEPSTLRDDRRRPSSAFACSSCLALLSRTRTFSSISARRVLSLSSWLRTSKRTPSSEGVGEDICRGAEEGGRQRVEEERRKSEEDGTQREEKCAEERNWEVRDFFS